MFINTATNTLCDEFALRQMYLDRSFPTTITELDLLGTDFAIVIYEEVPVVPEGFKLTTKNAELVNDVYTIKYEVVPTIPNVGITDNSINKILAYKASAYGYNSIDTAVSYAGYPNKYQEEGIQFGTWRSAVWEWFYENKDSENLDINDAPKFEDFKAGEV